MWVIWWHLLSFSERLHLTTPAADIFQGSSFFSQGYWYPTLWANIHSKSSGEPQTTLSWADSKSILLSRNIVWALLVQLLTLVWLATPWTAARQASLSITNSQSPPKPMSIESVMPSNHLILCHPLLLPPSIFPSIRLFSNESVIPIRWPKYWNFSFNISPSNERQGLISFRMDWLDLLPAKGLSRVFSNTTVQKHQFFGTQLSLYFNSHIHTWSLQKP